MTSSQVHQYSVEGVGEDFYPETVDLDLIDRWIKVSDADCVHDDPPPGPRGGRSWWVAPAGWRPMPHSRSLPKTTTALVVVILPDSGRGYLSKVFNDEWMTENGFEI